MYESLMKRDSENLNIFSDLKPIPYKNISESLKKFSSLPIDYLKFIEEIGVGYIADDGTSEHINLIFPPVYAAQDYFDDKDIFEFGAIGDIIVIGWDCLGFLYGFDTGNDFQMVRVSPYQEVETLDLTFYQFILGILVCYPSIPMKYQNNRWLDLIGEIHSL